ncbi:FKBP-type peptidyl-prolyl cis-trans isomerase [Methanothrix sp.]|jgi:peptidylprolyl isomerase|uniref:FKBP-type peptidyl-prolyl cis-trans isomerase n=1 Tax=Methanothrix sp. TaxID=90426 RepID=UPI001BD395A5
MAQAKIGDTVKVHYTGKLSTGVIFDTSEGCDPLEFEIGSGAFIPGFEEAVIGMSPGESKTVQIPPEKGYGNYREDRAITMDKKDFPSDLVPVEGMNLEICISDGSYVPAQVTDVTETTVTLDANHPLVEQTLYFDIKLIEITRSKEPSGNAN